MIQKSPRFHQIKILDYSKKNDLLEFKPEFDYNFGDIIEIRN